MQTFRLATGDYIIIAVYFIAVFAIAMKASQKGARKDSASYFLAGRNTGWFIIGASLFASNIGSEHLIGLAGTAAASGVAVAQFELLASLILLLLGWFFVPFYIKSGVFTMPEFLEKRYSKGARSYLALISVIGYIITKISVNIAAGGIVFETLMGIDFWHGALLIVVVTGIYTVIGGLRAVLYTDMLQMFMLIGGAVAVTVLGLEKLGGWSVLMNGAPEGFMSLWKPVTDPDFPWTGIVFGAPILGVWYWCTDQFIVQRVLSAGNISTARKGTIFGGFLKILPLFIFVLPGVIAFLLARKGLLSLTDPDHALPALAAYLLPAGLRGIVIAGLLAALMSSLSSVFNSCSTLITWDIYREMKPGSSEKKLVRVGQITTVFLVLAGIGWIPLMNLISDQLYKYIQSVQAYISPPIAAVFLFGILFKRVNAAGAITALISGFIIGIGRLLLELNRRNLEGLWLEFAEINFLHFALLLFIICSVILIAVSLLTAVPPAEKQKLSVSKTGVGLSDPGRFQNSLLSALLIAAIAAVWVYFS